MEGQVWVLRLFKVGRVKIVLLFEPLPIHEIRKQKHTVLFFQSFLSVSSIWWHDCVKYILFNK